MFPISARIRALTRYGFSNPFSRPRTELARLRRDSLGERFRGKTRLQRAALTVFCALVWPVVAGFETWVNLKNLRRERAGTGVAAGWRMYWYALVRNVPPIEYVLYDFENATRRAEWAQYLYWIDNPALKGLNRRRGADERDVQDKVRFAEICTELKLPHARVLASFRTGEAKVDIERIAEAVELWVKPIHLQGGIGAEYWRLLNGRWISAVGEELGRVGFVDRLRGRDCLVQDRLRNHKDVEGITNGWLASLRIVTGLDREGKTELLGNSLTLPHGANQTTSGGIGCVVGWTNGQIEQASKGLYAEPELRHPDTQERLVGRRIPFWQETLDLVQRAHRIGFSRFVTLGWDVALTPRGPILLETNAGWSTVGHQAMSGPLGRTALTRIVAEELRFVRPRR